MAPKIVIRTILANITMLTEKTIIEALPCFRIALCTTNAPRSDATKYIIAKMRAVHVPFPTIDIAMLTW